jgi:uncharacterized membrane protein YgcG
MTRSLLFPSLLAAAIAACLLFASPAWAKYAPPPLEEGQHVVTEVGWLSPSDLRKLDEEAEVAHNRTGFVIDVLLAKQDEPIDEVASQTFQAWKVGDPGKANGILLVFQPNFPRGERKVRLQIDKGAEPLMTPLQVNDLLRGKIGPLMNGGDQMREAVATGVLEIARIVGPKDPNRVDGGPATAPPPSPTASAPPNPPGGGGSLRDSEDSSPLRWIVAGGALAGLGFLAFRRFRGASKAGPNS